MDQLMEKLILSKKIMEKSDGIKRGSQGGMLPNEFDVPNANYNIPKDLLESSDPVSKSYNPNLTSVPTIDAINNSKLPENIKKLMIEHPIQQVNPMENTISNELVEKASRLMNNNSNSKPKETNSNVNYDYNTLKSMVIESVKEVLSESGLMIESVENTNEIFNFKVGKHLFEGKITKIKKLK